MCGACVMGRLHLGSVCVGDLRGTGRWEGQVRLGREVVPHVALLDQLLPVYCCTEVLSYEDNKTLNLDSSGTEAHPATDAILFQCLVGSHHMTGVSCRLLTFRQFGRHSRSQFSIMIKGSSIMYNYHKSSTLFQPLKQVSHVTLNQH